MCMRPKVVDLHDRDREEGTDHSPIRLYPPGLDSDNRRERTHEVEAPAIFHRICDF